eukprot:12919980-Prorocentrum_lima.AAC.1
MVGFWVTVLESSGPRCKYHTKTMIENQQESAGGLWEGISAASKTGSHSYNHHIMCGQSKFGLHLMAGSQVTSQAF